MTAKANRFAISIAIRQFNWFSDYLSRPCHICTHIFTKNGRMRVRPSAHVHHINWAINRNQLLCGAYQNCIICGMGNKEQQLLSIILNYQNIDIIVEIQYYVPLPPFHPPQTMMNPSGNCVRGWKEIRAENPLSC